MSPMKSGSGASAGWRQKGKPSARTLQVLFFLIVGAVAVAGIVAAIYLEDRDERE